MSIEVASPELAYVTSGTIANPKIATGAALTAMTGTYQSSVYVPAGAGHTASQVATAAVSRLKDFGYATAVTLVTGDPVVATASAFGS